MPSDTKDARFWDRIARKYAADPIKDMPGYERTLDRTRQLLRASDTVLELGCGTGTSALMLAPAVSRIVASDVSSEMIAIAREKVAAKGCPNVEFSVASAGGATGAGNSFDAVLAFNLLHLIADLPEVLRRVHHLLKPGGLFISKTPCISEMNPFIRLAIPVMRLVGKAPFVELFSAAGLENKIEGAGFAIIERARHGSGRKDPRVFIVAQKSRLFSESGDGDDRDHLATSIT